MFIRLNEIGLKLKNKQMFFLSIRNRVIRSQKLGIWLKSLEKNIEAVKKFSKPNKVKDVKAFIELCLYVLYRIYRIIGNISTIFQKQQVHP